MIIILLMIQTSISSSQPSNEATIATLTRPDSALVETLAAMRGQPLTLADARRLASNNSTEVLLAKAALSAAAGSLRRARGEFDPKFFAEIGRIVVPDFGKLRRRH